MVIRCVNEVVLLGPINVGVGRINIVIPMMTESTQSTSFVSGFYFSLKRSEDNNVRAPDVYEQDHSILDRKIPNF